MGGSERSDESPSHDASSRQNAGARFDVTAGSILVASPSLTEPTFRRTAIYLVEHNESGSLGVVLNRSSETAVHGVLPAWHDLAAKPKAVFVGGPVNQTAALCLGVVKPGLDVAGISGLQLVSGRVVLVDLDSDVDMMDELLVGVRVFAGYSGWGMGQLDDEIERDDWVVCPSVDGDVLLPAQVDVWARVLRRQGLPTALLATHPVDVSVN